LAAARKSDACAEEWEEVDGLEISELVGDFSDVVFLKKADGGDSGGSSFETGASVFERDAAKSKHGDFVITGLA
jgi:hypothetical protein